VTKAASTAAAQERRQRTGEERRGAVAPRRRLLPHPRPCPCRTERDRQTKRGTRKLDGECSVVEGPSGVSTWTTKAKVVALKLVRNRRDSKPDPAANIGTKGAD
jgi:hypothetical protein